MKHFVCADLHGRRDVFEQVKEYLKQFPEWRCVILGDVCDRGPDGYEMMKEVLADERFVYLKGNHEDMFAKAGLSFFRVMDEENFTKTQMINLGKEACHGEFISEEFSLSLGNGSKPTIMAWLNDGAPINIIAKLNQLPVKYSYKHFDMCHAGRHMNEEDDEKCLWNRGHFIASWFKDRVLIHGHTPISLMPRSILRNEKHYTWTPLFYNENEKINMDTGAVWTGRFFLFDMDTEEMIEFIGENPHPIDF